MRGLIGAAGRAKLREVSLKAVWKRLSTGLRVAFGLGLLAWVLSRTGLGAITPVLSAPWLLAVLVGFSIFGAAVEAERLRVLFRAAGLKLSWQTAYRVVPVGNFFNFCIPGGTGGNVVKLWYLARDNRRRGVEVATLLVVDRVLALSAVLVLVLLLMAYNHDIVASQPVLQALVVVAAGALSAILLLGALAWSTRVRASGFYRWIMQRLPLRHYLERAADAVHEFRDRKRAVLLAGLISFAGHMGTAAMYIVLASVIMPAAPWRVVCLLSMTGLLANAIPLTPGGMGVGEAAFDRLFALLGYHGGAVLLVLWRVGMLPLATLGAALYVSGQATAPRRMREEGAPHAS